MFRMKEFTVLRSKHAFRISLELIQRNEAFLDRAPDEPVQVRQVAIQRLAVSLVLPGQSAQLLLLQRVQTSKLTFDSLRVQDH